MTKRIEKDSLGEIEVDANVYWGAQTQRSLQFFNIGLEKMHPLIIESLAIIKKCAALSNYELNNLAHEKTDIIANVADAIIQGDLRDQFPLSIWQTGSGTQTNMNMNEVIANRSIQILGGQLGSKDPIHPNDDVNKGQSSNDVFPTAMNIATTLAAHRYLIPALEKLINILEQKQQEFKDIIKIGRTHLQDATPITLGQEFSGYNAQIKRVLQYLVDSIDNIAYLAQGGTAVGTGINTHPNFAELFAHKITKELGYTFYSANNKFAALASHDDLIQFSGTLNVIAVAINKIANDIRLLSCGPRSGLAELIIPANEPGSSIMPGKVNPTQIEAITMVCTQVIGQHQATTIAGMNGHLELNAYKPVIIHNILNSITLLSDGINSLVDHCIAGIQPNTSRIDELLNNSLMLVTALNQHIGYDNAAKLAKYAYQNNLTLIEANQQLKLLEESKIKELLSPKNMI